MRNVTLMDYTQTLNNIQLLANQWCKQVQGCALLPGSLDSTQLDALVITGGVLEKQVMHNIEFNLEDNSLILLHNICCS